MYGRVSRLTARKTGHVSSLAVLDEYRRSGIGRELMEILHVQVRVYVYDWTAALTSII